MQKSCHVPFDARGGVGELRVGGDVWGGVVGRGGVVLLGLGGGLRERKNEEEGEEVEEEVARKKKRVRKKKRESSMMPPSSVPFRLTRTHELSQAISSHPNSARSIYNTSAMPSSERIDRKQSK